MRAHTLDVGSPRKRSQMLPKLMLHRDNFQSVGYSSSTSPGRWPGLPLIHGDSGAQGEKELVARGRCYVLGPCQ